MSKKLKPCPYQPDTHEITNEPAEYVSTTHGNEWFLSQNIRYQGSQKRYKSMCEICTPNRRCSRMLMLVESKNDINIPHYWISYSTMTNQIILAIQIEGCILHSLNISSITYTFPSMINTGLEVNWNNYQIPALKTYSILNVQHQTRYRIYLLFAITSNHYGALYFGTPTAKHKNPVDLIQYHLLHILTGNLQLAIFSTLTYNSTKSSRNNSANILAIIQIWNVQISLLVNVLINASNKKRCSKKWIFSSTNKLEPTTFKNWLTMLKRLIMSSLNQQLWFNFKFLSLLFL